MNLLDMGIEWVPADDYRYTFKGYHRKEGKLQWIATRVDLVFGHHDELIAIAEVYTSDDAKEKLVLDFIAAWDKVMNF